MFIRVIEIEMQIFQRLKSYWRLFGIQPIKESTFNSRNVTVLLILCQFSLSAVTFFIFRAKTFREYAESFYVLTTAAINSFGAVTIILKAASVYRLIENFEKTIEDRK